MEVHHAHSPVKEKHFKHYFFEFLMLSLAITAGFFMENLREQMVEKKKGKEFIQSFTEDLKNDIYQLDSLTLYRQKRNIYIDSISFLLTDPDQYGKEIYYYSRLLTFNYNFLANDRTIQQLKNAGNMRLIHDQKTSDLIMDYDHLIRIVDTQVPRELAYVLKYINWLEELFDSRVYNTMGNPATGFMMPSGNPQLLDKNKIQLQKFMNDIYFLKSINNFLLKWFSALLTSAHHLLDYLYKEYHLKY